MTERNATVVETVKKLKEQGLSYDAIADRLHKLGIRTAKNTRPSRSYVNNIIHILRKQERRARTEGPSVAAPVEAAPRYTPRPWLSQLLNDPHLTAEQKLLAVRILLSPTP